MKSFSIEQINDVVNGELIGSVTQSITGAEQINIANSTQITFIGSKKFEKDWFTSQAAAAIVNQDITIDPGENRAFIKVANADLAICKVLNLFSPPLPELDTEIAHNAFVHSSASLGKRVKIGAGCYVGPRTILHDDVVLYPNATILDDCEIGEHTVVWSGVVVRERTKMGRECLIHPNATIGADGFGFRPDPETGLVKIPQIGNVVIGNQVEIGANTSIDRGKFSSTIIGDGCKIDNLVQIGHNCKLGNFCIMAGNSGLAGSVTLGNGVMIGGSASIKDHVTIGDRAIIGAGSGVTSDVPAGMTMLGYPALEIRDTLKQWAILKRWVKETKK